MIRAGEMMVIVRAQDFASRTLHRVSGEFAAMSRQQMLMTRGQDVQYQKRYAQSLLDTARANASGLKTVAHYNNLLTEQASRLSALRNAEASLTKLRAARSTGIRAAQQEIAMARQELDFFRQARRLGVSRKIMPPSIRTAGMERATKRLADAHNALEVAQRTNLGATIQAERAFATARTRYDQVTQSLGRYGEKISKLPGWLRQAAGSQFMFTQAQARSNRELERAYQGLNKAQRAELAFNDALRRLPAQRMHEFGAALSGVGRTMQLFGAVGTASFALMANSFAKFTASAATAGTQMRDIGAPMAQAVARSQELQEAILDMSMVFPNSAQDMTDAAYEIFSSMNLMRDGVMDVQSGLKLLAVANKAAVAGQVDLSEATNAMIVALNIFDPQLRDVQGTMDEVFNIVRFGRIHLDDLSRVFTQFASAAHAGGMSLKEVGAAFATLTLFQDPGKASAGLGRLIELLRTPQFKEGLKNLIGVDIIAPDTGKMKPLLTIMQEIVKARPDLEASRKAAIDFFIELTKASGKTKVGVQGTIQARRAFETFATHMDTFADTVNHVRVNYDEMNKAFRSRMADPGVQWQLFLNRMKALVLIIGKAALPVFLQLGRWISGMVRFIKGMNDGISGTIIRWAAWAAVGTLLAGILLSLGGGITQLIATMSLLRIAAATTGAAFVSMSTVMVASGIGAIIVASGIAAVLVIKHWNAVRAFFMAFMETLKADWADTMKQMAGLTLKGVAAIINPLYQLEKRIPFAGKFAKFLGPLNMVSAGLEKGGDALMDSADGFDQFWTRYRRIVKELGKGGKGSMDWLKDFKRIANDFDGRMLSEEYKKWANAVGDSTYTAAQRAKDHAQAVEQATENMQNTIKTATTNLVNLYEQMDQANRAAIGGLFQGPTMQGILGGIFSGLNDTLRQFGVQIPVPFAILKQDLDQSVGYFKRWRADITKLIKRGLPHETIAELQSMGIQGIPILEGLLAAPKGSFREIIQTYKEGQRLTDKATKEDMARKLKYWESFGQDAAWQTIMGIINNPRNSKIQKMYENYVKNTYGSILQKTFQDDVAEYMANAIKMAQAQAAAAKIMPPGMPNLFAPGGGKPTLATMTPRQLTNLYKTNARKITAMRFDLIQQALKGKAPTDEQQSAWMRLIKRRKAIIAEYARDAASSVRRQMKQQAGHRFYEITYQGDSIVIRADGATVASVSRALSKKHFSKKHKHGKGTTAKLPGGGPK